MSNPTYEELNGLPINKKKNDLFVQCRLRRISDDAFLTSWVPFNMARMRALVMVKKAGEKWDGLWIIARIFRGVQCSSDQVESMSMEYRYHRKRTDV